MTPRPAARTVADAVKLPVTVAVGNRSTHYAARWLDMLGFELADDAPTLITAGEDNMAPVGHRTIRLWDFQVGIAGTGVLASAASGAATVIGHADGLSHGLPADIPEKWCGAYGAILALAEALSEEHAQAHTYDVSAADVLRAFALQNAGSAEDMAALWRRNGRIAVQHGGIFPMGFFACRDGHVALLGRSRRDWRNIRAALDHPEWASTDEFADPFQLARNHTRADQLLEQTLAQFTRDDLLRRGLEHGAVIAPVYSQDEARARAVYRSEFDFEDGPAMPFVVRPFTASAPSDASHETDSSERVSLRGTSRAGPLAGLRCIELCWVWSGPLVGQILADLGAEVIKVESLSRFDPYRTRGLEHLRREMDEEVWLESSIYFHSLNRNKLGLTVDLKQERGIEVMKSLIARSDLLLDNFTAGTLDRLGLTKDLMQSVNPAITVLSMSGPGQGSALHALRSYGLVLSALGGAEYLIEDQGQFLGSPTYSLSDPNAALFATMGALAGAYQSSQTNIGSAVDVSQIEAAGTVVGTPIAGGDHDQYVAIVDSDGVELAISVPPSADAERLRADLYGASRATIKDRCQAMGIAFTEVNELWDTDVADVFNCNGWTESVHPVTGPERLVASPWRIDGKRAPHFNPAPRLNEHNEHVLQNVLGLSPSAVAALRADDVV